MKELSYACVICHYISEEDFWICPNCGAEDKVLEVSIDKFDSNIVFSYHNDDSDYNTFKEITDKFLKDNRIEYKSMYSQHDYQLNSTNLQFVAKT